METVSRVSSWSSSTEVCPSSGCGSMCSNTLPRNSNFNSAFAELRPTTSCNSVLPFWTSTLPNFSTTWGETISGKLEWWGLWTHCLGNTGPGETTSSVKAIWASLVLLESSPRHGLYIFSGCFLGFAIWTAPTTCAAGFWSCLLDDFSALIAGVNICNLRKSRFVRSGCSKSYWKEMPGKMFFFVPRVFNKVGACSKPRGRRKWEEGLIVKPEKKSSCLHILYVHVGVCISTSVHGCVFVCKLMHVRNREKQAVICVWKIVEAYIGAFELERAINKSQN